MNRSATGLLATVLAALVVSSACGLEIELVTKDGRVLRGSPGYTSGLIEQPQPSGQGVIQSIRFLDDHLRRVYLSKRQIREERAVATPSSDDVFSIWQRVRTAGVGIQTVGPVLQAQPFDSYGRRTLSFMSDRGQVDVVQGITELAPRWAKVEGITHVWDMRIPPSSIPPEMLKKILNSSPDAGQVEYQKKIARFFVEMHRYEDARAVLEKLLASHPGDTSLKEQIGQSIRQLRQLGAQRSLDELKRRREAGQHGLVVEMLKKFPSEGVAGEILQEVSELLTEYARLETQRAAVVRQLGDLLKQIDDTSTRDRLAPVVEEIAAELNVTTLPRLAAFRLAADGADLQPAEKLALAVSGWLLGANAAVPNLQVSLSAYRVRGLVRDYLNASARITGEPILQQLRSEEGAAPKTVALLLAHMKPPKPSESIEEKPGYFELEIPRVGKAAPVRYAVQLPPEYDPYRRWPTILSLHGAGGSPQREIDWWAGDWAGGGRKGQASRHGYIVVAPAWTAKQQIQYGYSADEHAAVLDVLRDACRRFAVDTDRVFLAGHSMGGDAAWDVALAHPDLWAGVIPIAARSDRYCSFYRENGRNVPFYFVGGEKDGRWLADNATTLDYYLTRGFNVTVVEYLGRGHEHYYDEIQNLFEWMPAQKRDFFPREFDCVSMRSWDNFFWWVEIDDLPERSLVAPSQWPPRGVIPMHTQSAILPTNGIRVRTGAGRVTVWLAPEMVDFDRRITVMINNRRTIATDPALQPNVDILLEDARTRADRQHPFWTRVEVGTGRG